MSDIDGFELLQRLVDVDYTGRLVAVSSGDNFDQMMVSLAEAKSRMSSVRLHKPFAVADIQAALGAV